jgi:hypothetical protein
MASSIVMPALPPTGWSFFLAVSDEIAGERGQQIRVKQLGPDLWSGRFESAQLPRLAARSLKAILHGILMQRTTFYGWDPGGQYPAADPLGAKIVTPANIKINSLNADAQRMSLKGLPASYKLTRGDYLSFNYGSPVGRALHQIWSPTTTTANASGVTTEFWVTPRIRPGAGIDAVVALEKPSAEMMIVPGSLVTSDGPRFGSISFEALQVLP